MLQLKNRFAQLIPSILFAIRTNFWVVPAAISIVAIALGILIAQIDFTVGQSKLWLHVFPTRMSIESARLALSTIAGSMITISSLVFSMTLVALTTVSQQLGPRVLMRFMDDRPTQIVLGLFLGSFLFSLILLMRVGDELQDGSVPGVGVMAATLVAVTALAGMIHFFDHTARRIQADSLINELGRDLNAAAGRFAAHASPDWQIASEVELQTASELFNRPGHRDIAMHTSGYLKRIDPHSAAAVAREHGVLIELQRHPDAFVLAGVPVLKAAPTEADGQISEKATAALCDLLAVGTKRTPEATVDFEITALLEVGLRALSPGINDPFTAIACLDRLIDGLRILGGHSEDICVGRDQDGTVRVIHAAEPFARYLEKAILPLAEAGRGNRPFEPRLLAALDDLAIALGVSANAKTVRELRARLSEAAEHA